MSWRRDLRRDVARTFDVYDSEFNNPDLRNPSVDPQSLMASNPAPAAPPPPRTILPGINADRGDRVRLNLGQDEAASLPDGTLDEPVSQPAQQGAPLTPDQTRYNDAMRMMIAGRGQIRQADVPKMQSDASELLGRMGNLDERALGRVQRADIAKSAGQIRLDLMKQIGEQKKLQSQNRLDVEDMKIKSKKELQTAAIDADKDWKAARAVRDQTVATLGPAALESQEAHRLMMEKLDAADIARKAAQGQAEDEDRDAERTRRAAEGAAEAEGRLAGNKNVDLPGRPGLLTRIGNTLTGTPTIDPNQQLDQRAADLAAGLNAPSPRAAAIANPPQATQIPQPRQPVQIPRGGQQAIPNKRANIGGENQAQAAVLARFKGSKITDQARLDDLRARARSGSAGHLAMWKRYMGEVAP